MALNAKDNLKIVTGKKAKNAEKLSSGYRINRSADDAAGLAISENMRRLIRGLDQGVENATDGISWSQSGDGALEEANEILHRMTELTVKSLSETNTDSDRMALEAEFEHLQSELDKISKTTTFNELNIFQQHEVPYYQCEGDVKWNPQQIHSVIQGRNDLTFTYRHPESAPAKSVTIEIPQGEYTTQELVDEIDNLISDYNKTADVELVFEFTEDGFCNVNLEGGEVLDSVSGNMSYLLYQMFRGGGYGALIGTTIFPNDYETLYIESGQNDTLEFTIEELQGGTTQKEIVIPAGYYTKGEIIDYLNNQLADTTVRATEYGSGIRLASEEAIVTGFKGNMFKIDGADAASVYNSVFYDNVKYGKVTQTAAELSGGYVLPLDSRDAEHRNYKIGSSNNQLTLQPNGAANPITLTIPEGNYTAEQMANKLNELFAEKQIDLNASRIVNSANTFEGIKIVSGTKGLDSQIKMDINSSAYETLFVNKEYNSYELLVKPVTETKSDSDGTFNGSKDLTVLNTTPLKIERRVNDQFKISIDGTAYTITMSEGDYTSEEQIRAEIDAQLNGANAQLGYKGKLKVSLNNGKIMLTGADGEKVDKVRVTAIANNNGYDNIFQGYKTITTTQTVTGKDSVTLNTKFDGSITDSEKNMTIKVDDVVYNVTLPTGDNLSAGAIENAIESVIKPQTIYSDIQFSAISATGTDTNNNFSHTATGTTKVTSWSGNAQGTSDSQEGVVGGGSHTPAVLQIGVNLNDNMVVGDSNNEITLTLNGVKKTITLEEKTYDKDSFQKALQEKIDEAFTTGMGGAIVSLNGNQLVLTSRLPQGQQGRATTISCSTGDSSFFKELNTTRTAAQWGYKALQSNIVIGDDNREFSFQYTENNVTRNITVSLSKGTYSPSSLAAELTNQLKGEGISAFTSANNILYLNSEKKGSDVKISYSTVTGGSSAEALFGQMMVYHPAKKITDTAIQNSITIEAGKSDTFNIVVNGNNKTITLDEGTYNREQFLSMLNTKLSGSGVKAYLENGKLGYETTDKGSSASFSMSYGNGGNSMKAIYGQSSRELSGIDVEIGADGTVKLTTTKSGSTIKVESNSGGPFQTAEVKQEKVAVSYSDGYHSVIHSYIDGVDLTEPVKINQWNNNFRFIYRKDQNTNPQYVYFEVPEGEYTFSQLQDKLQELLDNNPNTKDNIKATVSATGVRLESVYPGNTYNMSSFSGDFYDRVICKASQRQEEEKIDTKEGNQIVDSAFTVGRKDVKNKTTKIQSGISDELSLILTYGNTEHKLEMKLDGGNYTAEQLKQHLQEKVNEQLLAKGLPENLIEVGVGGVNTGVHGSNDQNALNFSLSKTIQAPAVGEFIIDGVSGNAAFEIFYQTDGSLEQAYIVGTKNIEQGVTIKHGKDELSFLVDGVSYDIVIPTGVYTAEEFKNTMNQLLQNANVPLNAELENGKIKLIHHKMGEHEIRDVSGNAVTTVFFNENGAKGQNTVNYVKMSSEDGDSIDLERPVFNTCSLKINSLCISKTKNANKALERLKDALGYLSSVRSNFGSKQNRLEHAVRNAENRRENLQYSESKIRDTDMSREMVALSNHNIILQAGQAMLSQARQIPQHVITLLQ